MRFYQKYPVIISTTIDLDVLISMFTYIDNISFEVINLEPILTYMQDQAYQSAPGFMTTHYAKRK